MSSLSLPVIMALVLSTAMTLIGTSIFLYHDRKHEDLDQWIDYGFSRETLKQALLYYRFIGTSMLVFLVLFVANLIWLQADGFKLFVEGSHGVIATTFFALDLVLRGAFFDLMEHWDMSITPLHMNRQSFWFVVYCFVFRMFYAMVLIRIAISFAWIWTKIRLAHKANRRDSEMG